MEQEMFTSQDSEDEVAPSEKKGSSKDSVIMDLNPKNFEKPKDHLFFDFFSLYAKNFIGDKSKPADQHAL